jgi:hypothetical protein
MAFLLFIRRVRKHFFLVLYVLKQTPASCPTGVLLLFAAAVQIIHLQLLLELLERHLLMGLEEDHLLRSRPDGKEVSLKHKPD